MTCMNFTANAGLQITTFRAAVTMSMTTFAGALRTSKRCDRRHKVPLFVDAVGIARRTVLSKYHSNPDHECDCQRAREN
jgi:hypothetical protein